MFVFHKHILFIIYISGHLTNVMIVPTPPAVTDPGVKPTLPIQQFKRQLYTQSDEPLVFHVRITGTKVSLKHYAVFSRDYENHSGALAAVWLKLYTSQSISITDL